MSTATMEVTFSREAMEETYHDVRRIITGTIYKFKQAYGGDDDDLECIADDAFLYAYETFDPENQTCRSFGKYVGFIVWKQLLEAQRQIARRLKRLPRVELSDLDRSVRGRQHFLTDFLDELSEDGKAIVDLLFDPPIDVEVNLRTHEAHALDLYSSRLFFKAAFREFLVDIGWERSRILDAFDEIERAL